jgi:hypothetical protein
MTKFVSLIVSVCLLLGGAFAQTKNANARQTVESFFALLKGQQYAKLYDLLPTQMQGQVTREQLAANLKRLESFLTLERMQIGRVQEKGEFAVVDTTIYGKLKQPMNFNGQSISEGRVTTQQLLFKENNQWKVITTDDRTRAAFLKRQPDFEKQFQLTKSQFAFKKDGQWQSLQPSRNMNAR